MFGSHSTVCASIIQDAIVSRVFLDCDKWKSSLFVYLVDP